MRSLQRWVVPVADATFRAQRGQLISMRATRRTVDRSSSRMNGSGTVQKAVPVRSVCVISRTSFAAAGPAQFGDLLDVRSRLPAQTADVRSDSVGGPLVRVTTGGETDGDIRERGGSGRRRGARTMIGLGFVCFAIVLVSGSLVLTWVMTLLAMWHIAREESAAQRARLERVNRRRVTELQQCLRDPTAHQVVEQLSDPAMIAIAEARTVRTAELR